MNIIRYSIRSFFTNEYYSIIRFASKWLFVATLVVPLCQPRDKKKSFQSGYNYCYDFNKSAIITHTRSSHQPHSVNDENILCLCLHVAGGVATFLCGVAVTASVWANQHQQCGNCSTAALQQMGHTCVQDYCRSVWLCETWDTIRMRSHNCGEKMAHNLQLARPRLSPPQDGPIIFLTRRHVEPSTT